MKRFGVLAFALAMGIAGFFLWGYAAFNGAGPKHGHETVVVIKSGIGLRGIAKDLGKAGVVSNADLFYVCVRLSGKTHFLKAGEYAIPDAASMADIVDLMASGRSVVHKVTVAEGLTSQMALDLVNAKSDLSGDAGAVPEEGTLLPETYLFERGTSREDILKRMRTAQEEFLERQWPMRDTALPLKTKREALILASVVEKETALPQERRHVAAVFYNRLKTGMKLQSDPTIIYGLTKGYPLGRGIRKSEIEQVTPYNTYAIVGLPAAPICNPGKDSIAAVLHPDKSNDLYFVANGSGGHAFAATIDEQVKNVAHWRTIEKKKQPSPAKH